MSTTTKERTNNIQQVVKAVFFRDSTATVAAEVDSMTMMTATHATNKKKKRKGKNYTSE